ncbi:MAG: hypothetical protein R3C01_09230 [Planctomycetaceae bacterium]
MGSIHQAAAPSVGKGNREQLPGGGVYELLRFWVNANHAAGKVCEGEDFEGQGEGKTDESARSQTSPLNIPRLHQRDQIDITDELDKRPEVARVGINSGKMRGNPSQTGTGTAGSLTLGDVVVGPPVQPTRGGNFRVSTTPEETIRPEKLTEQELSP